MDQGSIGLHAPRRARVWRALSGPLLTLAVIALTEALRPTPLHFPGPGIILLIVVAWSTYVGGFVPGLASCVLTLAYASWFYLTPPVLAEPGHVRRLVDLVVGAPGITVMMGVLRRRAEHARHTAAEAAVARQYALLFEEAGEPMLLSDSSHRYVFANRRACEVSGYSREELLRMRVAELVSPRSLADRPLRVDELQRSKELRTERELVRRDGAVLRVDVNARRLDDGTTLVILRDITEERAAVERLQHALSLVRATLESTTDGILVVDESGHWSGCNARFGEMWALSPAVIESGDDRQALEIALPQVESPDEFLRTVQDLYATPAQESFDEIRLKDGRVFERYSLPQRMGDRIVGRVWSFRDVTGARRQAEALRVTQQQLVHSEKMDAVGRLAGGIAHDFNNMLTAILGEADFLLMRSALDPAVRVQVENIRSAALRSAALTRQLLAFARRQHAEPRAMALCDLVRGLEPLIQRLAGSHVRTRVDLPGNGAAPWVCADPAHLEQAILNLVINAGDAMPDGGELVLSVTREHVDPADRERRGAKRDGSHASLSVIDTGCGIPEGARPYVFEPFFTTKPPGQGTGLGLASVHGIIEQAHGFIEMESELGRGTTFRILLPEHPPGLGQQDERSPALASAAGGSQSVVLVVDDEEAVRRFAAAVLEAGGYRVVQAAGGLEALDLARGLSAPAALLLSDVVMPGTTGPELARALLGEGLVRRVMFMSGYPGTSLSEQLAELAAVPLMQKPFRSDELLERVHAALETRDASSRA